MKAQSDLTGDRERAAEMTVPRASGATMWIDRIATASKSITGFATEGKSLIDSFKPQIEFSALNELPKITLDDEVNHCPADQQWSVSTP